MKASVLHQAGTFSFTVSVYSLSNTSTALSLQGESWGFLHGFTLGTFDLVLEVIPGFLQDIYCTVCYCHVINAFAFVCACPRMSCMTPHANLWADVSHTDLLLMGRINAAKPVFWCSSIGSDCCRSLIRNMCLTPFINCMMTWFH